MRALLVGLAVLALAPTAEAVESSSQRAEPCAGRWYSDHPRDAFCRTTALRRHARVLRRQAVRIASRKWRAEPRALRLAWSVPPMKAEHAWWRSKVTWLARAKSLRPPVPHYSTWLRLAQCESGGNWRYNGPSGYDGGLQYSPGTWRASGGGRFAPYAWGATPIEQMIVAEVTLRRQGWGAWPACSSKLGLR